MSLFLYLSAIKELYQFNYTGSKSHRMAKEFVATLDLETLSEKEERVPPNFLEKVQWYVTEFQFSCRHFDTLFEIQSSESSLEAQKYAAVLGVLSDLIIDDLRLEEDELSYFFDNQNLNSNSSAALKAFHHYYMQFQKCAELDLYPDRKKYLELVLKAQIASKRQFSKEIKKEEVDQICRDKCGYSLLFMRSMIDRAVDPKEVKIWYELGSYIQFANDSQDLPKDSRTGIKTFATTRRDFDEIWDDLDMQKDLAFQLVSSLEAKEKRKRFLLEILTLMHHAILSKIKIYKRVSSSRLDKLSQASMKEIRRETSSWRLLIAICLMRLSKPLI